MSKIGFEKALLRILVLVSLLMAGSIDWAEEPPQGPAQQDTAPRFSLSLTLTGQLKGVTVTVDFSQASIDEEHIPLAQNEFYYKNQHYMIPVVIKNDTNSSIILNPYIDNLFVVKGGKTADTDLFPSYVLRRPPNKVLAHSQVTLDVGIAFEDYIWFAGANNGLRESIRKKLGEGKQLSDIKFDYFNDSVLKGEFDIDSISLNIPLSPKVEIQSL